MLSANRRPVVPVTQQTNEFCCELTVSRDRCSSHRGQDRKFPYYCNHSWDCEFGFTCRADNETHAAVVNNDDLIRRLCLLRVRWLQHREGIRDPVQEPKHECY